MRKIKLSIDPQSYISKPNEEQIPKIQYRLAKPSNQVEITIEQLKNKIQNGQAFSSYYDGNGKKEKNFKSLDILAFDVDNKDSDVEKHGYLSSEQAIKILKDKDIFVNMIYHSFSNTETKEKYRLILFLDKTETDTIRLKKSIKAVMRLIPQLDKACCDLSRYFNGSDNCEIIDKESMVSLDYIIRVCPPEPIVEQKEYTEINKDNLEEILKDLEDALPSLSNTIKDRITWAKVGFACRKLGASGRELFLRISMSQGYHKDTRESILKFYDGLDNDNGSVGINTLFYMALQNGWVKQKREHKENDFSVEWDESDIKSLNTQDKEIKKTENIVKVKDFWTFVESEKGSKVFDKPVIDEELLLNFFTGCGYRKLPESEESKLQLVQICGVFIKNILPNEIIDNAKKYIYKYKGKDFYSDLLKAFIKRNNSLGARYWSMLDTITPDKLTDKSNKSYHFFRNGYVKIDSLEYKLTPYNEYKGYIWKNNINNIKFIDTSNENKIGEFETFLRNTQKDVKGNLNRDRWISVRSIIGNTLHNYFNASEQRALLLYDEEMTYNHDANGGNGKSLIAKAIQTVRKGLLIDAKGLKENDQFVFDRLKKEDQTIYFDDCNNKFDYEKLFTQIQTPVEINSKFKKKFTIDNVPQYILSSNYTIDITTQSARRRAMFIFCGIHYGKDRTPYSDFKHNLFQDWNDLEWNRFYNFMFECIRFYLDEKTRNDSVIKQYYPENYQDKQIMSLCCNEGLGFLKQMVRKGNKLEYNDTLTQYRDITGDQKITQRQLTKLIQKYSVLNKYRSSLYQANNKSYYIIE